MYLDFSRIPSNNWYMLKPATFNAVINPYRLRVIDQRTPTSIPASCIPLSHDQSSASLTYSLDTHSRLLQCCPADTSSLINQPNYLHNLRPSQEVSPQKELNADTASSFHDRVECPRTMMALKSPMLSSPDRNLMSAFSPYSESPTSPAPFRSPITHSRPVYVRSNFQPLD